MLFTIHKYLNNEEMFGMVLGIICIPNLPRTIPNVFFFISIFSYIILIVLLNLFKLIKIASNVSYETLISWIHCM